MWSARARTTTALAPLKPATMTPTQMPLHTELLQPFVTGYVSTHGEMKAHMPAPSPSAKMRTRGRARLSSVLTADPSRSVSPAGRCPDDWDAAPARPRAAIRDPQPAPEQA